MSGDAIERLLVHTGADRAVRTYAYLTVSFNTRRDVNDVLDCLLPFVISVLQNKSDQPVQVQAVADGLSEFGLSIPVYALQNLLGRLAKRGIISWNTAARAYLVNTDRAKPANDNQFSLSATFDKLEECINRFALVLGVDRPPTAPSWADALIDFLRSEKSRETAKAINIKGALLGQSAHEIQTFIIVRFIQHCELRDREIFDNIVRVFTGILIEDFISNIQEIGDANTYRGLSVYYDTSVLLRLLGASGRLMETATLDMHQALQALGCSTYYFDLTATEVQNILDALVGSYSRGKEIHGETADALHNGEISIGQIKDLAGTFADRLAILNVFPFDYNFAARSIENAYQIDEEHFANALISHAMKDERGYSLQNARNDAQVFALIIRLRRGRAAKQIARSAHLLVSKNSLFQRVARQFVADHIEEFDDASVPPVFTLVQITTVAWLATTKKLESHKVSRELLANCYSAVQPSSAWADEFAAVLAKFEAENPEFVAQRANSMIFLQSARETARDESLNQPAILRRLNVAELFRQADARANEENNLRAQREEQLRNELEEARKAATVSVQEQLNAYEAQTASLILETQRIERERAEALAARGREESRIAERIALQAAQDEHKSKIAGRIARLVVNILKTVIVILFCYVLVADSLEYFESGSSPRYVILTALGAVTLLSLMDLLGIKIVSVLFDKIEERFRVGIERVLAALFLGPTQSPQRLDVDAADQL